MMAKSKVESNHRRLEGLIANGCRWFHLSAAPQADPGSFSGAPSSVVPAYVTGDEPREGPRDPCNSSLVM